MHLWPRLRFLCFTLLIGFAQAAEHESDEVCDLKTATENGDLGARWRLILRECNYVPHDYVEAASMLTANAKEGDGDSADMLGQLYRSGEGVPKNYLESVRWLQKSVAAGNVYAQYHLGQRYENGEGVPQDLTEAYFWYVTSAALQYNDGFRLLTMKRRDQIEKKLTNEAVAAMQERSAKWVADYLKKQNH